MTGRGGRTGACLALLVLCGGCEAGAPAVGEPEAIALASRVVSDAEAFGRPADLAIVGEFVAISDGLGDPALHVVRIADGALLASFGREGSGPGEFRAPRVLSLAPDDPAAVWLYDVELRRATEVDLARVAAGAAEPARRSILFRADQLPLHPVRTGDGWISPGIFTAGRVARFDTAGEIVGTFGEVPATTPEAPVNVAQHAFTGTLAADRDGGRLVLAARHSDRIDVFAGDGTFVRTIRGPRRFEPVFQVARQNGVPYLVSGEDLRFGYLDVALLPDRIVALYSGRTRAEHAGNANVGDEVHVFDGDGSLVRRFRLDHETLTLAVSPDGRRLYTMRRNPTPALLVHDLPPL